MAAAQAPITISATADVAAPGASVVVTVIGTPGQQFAVIGSATNAGMSYAGQALAVGTDVVILRQGVLDGTGKAVVPVTPPFRGTTLDRYYLQAVMSANPSFVPLQQSSGIVIRNLDLLQGLIDGQGPPGPPGPQGPAGAAGAAGAQGPAGEKGLTGAQGPAGSQGPQGPEGQAGAQGPIGPQGPAGAEGAAGAQGPAGSTGPAGAAGLDGQNGAQGPPGPAGATGATGGQGIQGLAGTPGTALTLAAVVNADGTTVWKSADVTIARTGFGEYTFAITPGLFTGPAIPMFMPMDALIADVTSDWLTSGTVTFNGDTRFHFVMVQVRP
jgi:hypothetical protein